MKGQNCIYQDHKQPSNMVDSRSRKIEHVPEVLRPLGRMLEVKPSSALFHIGNKVQSLFYVIEGELMALRYQYRNGQKVIMARARPGEYFVPASMMMEHYPCDAYASARMTFVWAMPMMLFKQTMESSSTLTRTFTESLSLELKKQCARVECLRLGSLRERVFHYIGCHAHDGKNLLLDHSLKHWAEELGVEPESLYRTLRQMKNKREISRVGRRIRLLKQA